MVAARFGEAEMAARFRRRSLVIMLCVHLPVVFFSWAAAYTACSRLRASPCVALPLIVVSENGRPLCQCRRCPDGKDYPSPTPLPLLLLTFPINFQRSELCTPALREAVWSLTLLPHFPRHSVSLLSRFRNLHSAFLEKPRFRVERDYDVLSQPTRIRGGINEAWLTTQKANKSLRLTQRIAFLHYILSLQCKPSSSSFSGCHLLAGGFYRPHFQWLPLKGERL